MKKKILSIFCSGLMFFANAPCCAALGGEKAQIYDSISDLSNNISVEVSLVKNDSDSNLTGECLYMSIEQVKLMLSQRLQPDGSWTTQNSSSYIVNDNLSVSLSLAYISNKDEDIAIEFYIDSPKDLPNLLKSNDGTIKDETINNLEKLKGLRFKLHDKSATYLKCEVGGVNTADGKVNVTTEDSNELTLNSSKPNSTSSNSTKTLTLSISKNESVNPQVSLSDAISALADLESKGYYRFQIVGKEATT